MAASENMRTGLVELRTSTGSVYARPSFWERLYLVWMFRNFRCLPKEVLTHHQQRLIDKLCQVAVRQRSIADSEVIGIVENVRLVPSATSASNLIEMVSSTVKYSEPRAVAAGGTTARWDPPSDRSEPPRLVTTTAQLAKISPSAKPSPQPSEAEPETEHRVQASPWRYAWVLVAALVLVTVGIFLRLQIQSRPVTLPSASLPPEVEKVPVAVSVPVSPIAETRPLQPSDTPTRKPSAGILEDAPSRQGQPEGRHSDPVAVRKPVAPPIADEKSTSEPRLQIAQPPVSGFRYPETPSSSLTGKVNLRALIGSDGSVRKVDILSGNRVLAAAAVQAVRHWRYSAPELDGHAVEAETNIAINFVGDDAVSVSFPAAR